MGDHAVRHSRLATVPADFIRLVVYATNLCVKRLKNGDTRSTVATGSTSRLQGLRMQGSAHATTLPIDVHLYRGDNQIINRSGCEMRVRQTLLANHLGNASMSQPQQEIGVMGVPLISKVFEMYQEGQDPEEISLHGLHQNPREGISQHGLHASSYRCGFFLTNPV